MLVLDALQYKKHTTHFSVEEAVEVVAAAQAAADVLHPHRPRAGARTDEPRAPPRDPPGVRRATGQGPHAIKLDEQEARPSRSAIEPSPSTTTRRTPGTPMLAQDVPFFLGQLPRRRQTVLEIGGRHRPGGHPDRAGGAPGGGRGLRRRHARHRPAQARRRRPERPGAVADRGRHAGPGPGPAVRLGLRFLQHVPRLHRACPDRTRACRPSAGTSSPAAGSGWTCSTRTWTCWPAGRGHRPGPHRVLRSRSWTGRSSMVTDVRRMPEQVQRVTFRYTWFDAGGREHHQRVEFDMTWLFPRELRLLLERNGLRGRAPLRRLRRQPGRPRIAAADRPVLPGVTQTS